MNVLLRHGLPVLLAAALAGCGYHLRGTTPLTWNLGRLYVEGDRSAAPLAEKIRRLLAVSDVSLAAQRSDADAVLTIGSEDFDRRVLSVDPQTGKVREYELEIEAHIGVTRPDGTVLLPDQSVLLQRDYTFDETAALGKFEEESTLRGDLREDAAGTIVRRLQAVTKQPASAAATVP